MFSITSRYFLRQLSLGLVLVAIGLTCILWLTQSLRFVELIVEKGVSIGTFVQMTLLVLPNFLAVIVPISVFSVILFVYSKLISDREIVALRAAGMGHLALARAGLLLALFATALTYAMTLVLIPRSVEGFKELQWEIRNEVGNLLLQEGAFNDLADGITVYVREREGSGTLLGLLVHDRRDPGHPVTVMAERGALIRTENGPRVLMVNGNRQERKPGTGELAVLYFDSYTIEIGGGEAAGERARDRREIGLIELLTTQPGEVAESDFRRYRVEVHQRLVSPLYNLTYALVAMAALLTGAFSRRGQGKRVLTAVTIIVLIQSSALGFANLAGKNLAFLPLIHANALLPMVVAISMLWIPRMSRPQPAAA